MKYVEEYLKDVTKVKPLGELTTKDDELNGMSGEMVYIDGKCSDIFISHADYANWLEKQSEEARNIALRTEYEKGRADAIAEMQKEQTQEYLKGADRVQNYKELTKFEKGFDRIADTYAHRKNKDGYNKPWYTQERAAEMLYWAKEELGLLDKQKSTDKGEPKSDEEDFIF